MTGKSDEVPCYLTERRTCFVNIVHITILNMIYRARKAIVASFFGAEENMLKVVSSILNLRSFPSIFRAYFHCLGFA